ncbi:MAG: TlpA family protein disulfide reductase [Candidatus Paceibacteria bacterium]
MRKVAVLFSMVSLAFILIGCTHQDKQESNKSTTRADFFQLKLKSLEGGDVALSKFKGKKLVINSWASWCGFCKEELSDFGKVKSQLNENIKIIAVNRGESKQKIQPFLDQLEHRDELIFLLDKRDRFYQEIGGFAMPETILVNEKGEIVFHKRGPMNAEELKKQINKHLLNN